MSIPVAQSAAVSGAGFSTQFAAPWFISSRASSRPPPRTSTSSWMVPSLFITRVGLPSFVHGVQLPALLLVLNFPVPTKSGEPNQLLAVNRKTTVPSTATYSPSSKRPLEVMVKLQSSVCTSFPISANVRVVETVWFRSPSPCALSPTAPETESTPPLFVVVASAKSPVRLKEEVVPSHSVASLVPSLSVSWAVSTDENKTRKRATRAPFSGRSKFMREKLNNTGNTRCSPPGKQTGKRPLKVANIRFLQAGLDQVRR